MEKKNIFQTALLKIFDLFFGRIIEEKIKNGLETIPIKGFYGDEMSTQRWIETIGDELAKINSKLTPERTRKITSPYLIEFSEKKLKILTEKIKREKDEKIFHTSLPCWENGLQEMWAKFPLLEYIESNNSSKPKVEATGSIKTFVETIFATNCVAQIVSENAFHFKLTKPGSLTWDEVMPKITEAIASLFPDVD